MILNRVVAAVFLLASAGSIGACGGDDDDAGTAPAGAASPTSSAAQAGLDVSAFDPCSALTDEQLSGLGLATEPSTRSDDEEGATCGWASGATKLLVGRTVLGVEEFNEDSRMPDAKPTRYGGRDAYRASDDQVCAVLFEASGGQTLVIMAVDGAGDHCALADRGTDQVLAALA